jgi:hypothetical protein
MENQPTKLDVKYNEIYDSANRLQLLLPLFQQIGLSVEDATILSFIVLGNTAGETEPTLPEILKKIKLPRKNSKYDTTQLERFLQLIGKEIESFDKYGIVKMNTQELVRFSKNHKYITLYGMNVMPLTYKNMVRLLTTNPGYVISVILGVYDALGIILKFLKVIE